MPYGALSSTTAAPPPAIEEITPLTNGGMTLVDFREELVDLLGGRDDIKTERLERWINRAYQDIATSLQLPEVKRTFTISTSANQPGYNLPDSVVIIKAASLVDETTYLDGGIPLSKIDLNGYRRRYVESGSPSEYLRYGNMLVLWRTPDSSYVVAIEAVIRPEPLTEDNHSPVISSDWYEAILLAARERAFSGLMELTNAALARNERIAHVRDKVDVESEEASEQLLGVSVPRCWRDVRRGPRLRREEP